jgi:hypothetical protein
MKKFLMSLVFVSLNFSACTHTHHKHDSAHNKKEHKKCCSMKKKESKEMSMNPEDMMLAMQKASTPGEKHTHLNPLVGTWKTTTKWWSHPGVTPEVTKGTSKSYWILGNRFVAQDFKGLAFGKPFEGHGMIGYDNSKEEYVSVWLDTMGTGMMLEKNGSYDSKTSELTLNGTFDCPYYKTTQKTKSVTKFISPNVHTFSMYVPDKSGKMFKNLEITYLK